ncbi:uncharacterized protein MONBRDRAFT_34204 [Monosiga brevicollis MX1]|uniref:Cleavage stimulation factor 50 kDa subunit n=1 Tax=Monosiga brevicollis TaxID=81824 RepID=A9VA75_MONBE|nr:uncharacterized protein MONBRDRAFT_34204 [Monosiga brevicollis MX1]EDQ85616.1 predicted protein [Monosiga brevicollis MX1]|eukprot:XP_001749565.1 hypothetical protein [Monosiga brevicollis MX1]
MASTATAEAVGERHDLYRSMMQQLLADGHHDMAQQLAERLSTDLGALSASSGLYDLFAASNQTSTMWTQNTAATTSRGLDFGHTVDPATLDARFELKAALSLPSAPTVCAVSRDGELFAVGCQDGRVRVYRSRGLVTSTNMVESGSAAMLANFDGSSPVSALAFHPTKAIISAGSTDGLISHFDFTPNAQNISNTLQDPCGITALEYHPTGAYLLVAAEHPTLRLYNTDTWQCYRPANWATEHTAPLCAARFTSDAKTIVTACTLGMVKVWSAVSLTCLKTHGPIFDMDSICNLQLSSSGTYALITSSTQRLVLMQLDNGRVIFEYKGATPASASTPAAFAQDEALVLWADESGSIAAWNTRTAEPLAATAAHPVPILTMYYSEAKQMLLTGSGDRQLKLWQSPSANVATASAAAQRHDNSVKTETIKTEPTTADD